MQIAINLRIQLIHGCVYGTAPESINQQLLCFVCWLSNKNSFVIVNREPFKAERRSKRRLRVSSKAIHFVVFTILRIVKKKKNSKEFYIDREYSAMMNIYVYVYGVQCTPVYNAKMYVFGMNRNAVEHTTNSIYKNY